ncbi:MAG: hypothetical protein COT25_03610 [Candidatus Kerfeldbacteria bacterium CG08_land_8_20_14_0_20_42_7]|uniref:Serine aminopeptidase S33 domain-containing protein n=1 Tax=Candidatus Kerfeldbacteria bacterium CG08_land_8_20_14_0_20_42_7 TaxID=2014245 RepID=A0A2H0YS71_9BACT|nr:MAG: hypothetical protein COT25_03610 [Candidatus Kerfeldbacteria bacterium CG08_land_8_20_14_0_20_42_7]
MNNKTKLFRVLQNEVAGDFYFASSSRSPSVVFLQGLPGSMKKNDVGNFLSSVGYSLFNLEYPGTFNNGGNLTPRNCVKGAVNAIKLLQSGKITDVFSGVKHPISQDVVLSGTSFGAAIALSAIAQVKSVTRLLLFSPVFLFSKDREESGLTEDMSSLITYMKRCLPHTHRLADEGDWTTLFSGTHPDFQARKKLNALNGKKILVVRGAKDKSILESASSYFQELLKTEGVSCEITTLTVEEGHHDYRTLLTSDVKEQALAFLSEKE